MFEEGSHAFGIRCYDDPETEQAYQFIFHCNENRYICEKNPNWPWFTYLSQGSERPIELISNKIYNIRLIIDDTIAVIYVDGVALSARMYTKPGDAFGIFVSEGKIHVKNCSVSTKLKKSL
jgi:hypothetical protein